MNNSGFYLFLLRDLSEVTIFEQSDLEDAVENGELTPFYPILKIEEAEQYGKLLYNSIIDTTTNELIYIEPEHITTRDQQYIYLNGGEDPLQEGVQRIQSIEDYLAGNDTIFAEFDLDYKEISKPLDFRTTNNVSRASVVYFSEDFIVLYINYRAFITGKAGSTNVLIDLQDKENPIYYLVDLGIIL